MHDVDELGKIAFRHHMKALARKGGLETKRRRLESDPNFFRDIGAMGGRASIAALRAKFVDAARADEDAAFGERSATIAPAPVVCIATPAIIEPERAVAPAVFPSSSRSLSETLDDIMRELEGPTKRT